MTFMEIQKAKKLRYAGTPVELIAIQDPHHLKEGEDRVKLRRLDDGTVLRCSINSNYLTTGD
jgi:hypothetical protein